MKFKRGYESDDVELRGSAQSGGGGRRGRSAGGAMAGQVAAPILRKLGVPGVVVTVLVALLASGGLPGGGGGGDTTEFADSSIDADDPRVDFMEFVFDDVQNYWVDEFERENVQYERVKLVIFESNVNTGGCGFATAAVGPFYCPADSQAYLDLGFFDELASRFGAPGDFAQAYVVAHEVGHHIQNVLGTSSQVRAAQQQNPNEANTLSIRLELQADCYAGVWANSAADLIEPGDINEGLAAAEAVGDDRIQESAGVDVNPHTWTHGSAEQRNAWFSTGLDSGDPDTCDTFSGAI